LDRSTLVVAISQSGETADTLEAVRHAKAQKAKVLAICNTNGSQIPRECDAVLYTRDELEIGGASTQTSLAQIADNSALTGRFAALLGLALRVHFQDHRQCGLKVYALHEVECIG
jgi:glucosamine 6-phosphate synthetase-like amidotransferase/phosphosugar isomerase protein